MASPARPGSGEGLGLIRETALLLAADLHLSDVFLRLGDLLKQHLQVSMVRFIVADDVSGAYEYVFTDSAMAAAPVILPIPFRERNVGTLIVRWSGDRPRREHDILLLESCAASLGARISDESARSERVHLKELALHDGLTGLLNRRGFDETLQREWHRCERSGSSLSLLMMDIDYFKVFNDTYGHLAGDSCLQQVAKAIARCVNRPGDACARYGGEEFVVVLPETDGSNAALLGESIAESVRSARIAHEGSSLGYVTLSIGCASIVPHPEDETQSLISAADVQLYRAKENGRNRVATVDGISDAPRAGRKVVIKHNIPPSRTTFVGRDQEVAALQSLFPKARLVTIVGMGGSGKTRLARETGLRLADRYQDGVWFVDLTSVQTGEGIPHAIASTFHPGIARTIELPMLLQMLRDKQMLLILDNAEHIIDDCAKVVDGLLDAVKDVQVLVTSREPLAIDGEHVFRLGFLTDDDSAALFGERARAAGAEHDIDLQSAAATSIVAKLEGVPLAIELAATRASVIALDDLCDELDNRLAALKVKSRSSSSRHQTLEAVFEWSYGLLSEGTQRAFRHLAVFSGGWTRDAAVAVCDSPESLDDLTEKSLVVKDTRDRYRFLESTREYALKRLQNSGDFDLARLRHANYFQEYAKGSLVEPLPQFSVLQITHYHEVPNYVAALETFLDTGGLDEAAETLWDLRLLVGDISNFRSLDAKLRKAVTTAGIGDLVLARFLNTLATMNEKRESKFALEAAREAQRLFSDSGDLLGWAHATETVSSCELSALGKQITSEEIMLRAIEIARRHDNRHLAATLLCSLGVFHGNNEDYDRALSCFLQSKDTSYDDDVQVHAFVAGNMAMVFMHLQRYDEAVTVLEQTLDMTERSRPSRMTILLINLALAHWHRQDHAEARKAAHRALEYSQRYVNLFTRAAAFDVFTLLATSIAKFEDAVRLGGFAQACFEQGPVRQELDQRDFDRAMSLCRGQLGDEAFQTLWQRGRMMTGDEASLLAQAV